MQVKLLTSIGRLQEDIRDTAKAAQITRGNADKELSAVGEEELLKNIIKLGHESVIEHIVLKYRIFGLSRACLQELARHRLISLTVESTRYTLRKNLNNEEWVKSFRDSLDEHKRVFLDFFVKYANEHPEMPNDELKYLIPEFWPTTLTLTVNARELRHIIDLRTAPVALQEFQDLAHAFFDVVPNEFKFLLEDCVHQIEPCDAD